MNHDICIRNQALLDNWGKGVHGVHQDTESPRMVKQRMQGAAPHGRSALTFAHQETLGRCVKEGRVSKVGGKGTRSSHDAIKSMNPRKDRTLLLVMKGMQVRGCGGRGTSISFGK